MKLPVVFISCFLSQNVFNILLSSVLHHCKFDMFCLSDKRSIFETLDWCLIFPRWTVARDPEGESQRERPKGPAEELLPAAGTSSRPPEPPIQFCAAIMPSAPSLRGTVKSLEDVNCHSKGPVIFHSRHRRLILVFHCFVGLTISQEKNGQNL